MILDAARLRHGTDFVYDAVTNEIGFTGYAPPVGTTRTIAYRAVP